MDIILSIGSFNAFIFALILFSKREKLVSDKLLAFWMVIFGIDFLSIFLGGVFDFPGKYFCIGIASVVFLTHFPILYIYAKSLTIVNFNLRKVALPHLVFLVIVSIVGIIPFAGMNKEQLDTFSYSLSGYFLLKFFMIAVYLFFVAFYLLGTYRLI